MGACKIGYLKKSEIRITLLVCSEKVQFAPQSRNCEVEGELARDKTSSIFTVEEKVAVFERGEIDPIF